MAEEMRTFDLLAVVLLAEEPEFDLAAFAATLRDRYPELGAIEDAFLELTIEGEPYLCHLIPTGYPYDLAAEGLKPLRAFDPSDALASCRSHLMIWPRERRRDRDGAKWQAAVLQLIAAAAVDRLPGARAVFWNASQGFQAPEDAEAAVAQVLDDRSPIDNWIQFYPIWPSNPELADRKDLLGMVTLGLTPFIGREIELAFTPLSMEDAGSRCFAAAYMLLDGGSVFSDHDTISDDAGGSFMVIRDRPDGWLRPGDGLGALALIPPDSVVDPGTMEIKAAEPEKRSMLSRVLGRKH